MKTVGLNKDQYAKLKNLSYYVYLLDHSTTYYQKAQRIMKEELEKYDNNEMKTVVYNTLLFPFDVELYNLLMGGNGKISEKDIQVAADKFDIPVDVVKQKLNEYLGYGFINLVGEGKIEYDVTLKLSKLLLTMNDPESKKNPK